MKKTYCLLPITLLLAPLMCGLPPAGAAEKPAASVSDPRLISNGSLIPSEGYADQPYIVKTDDGAWLCVMTTGAGKEGAGGQHVVTMRSTDQGRTWGQFAPLEPADGPEASYAVLLKVPGGRIYAFYNHNTDNLRAALADNPPFKDGKCTRVDSLGYFVFKFSDDGGKSWSPKRYPIPQRLMDIDRCNPYQGKVLYFWNVGKPVVHAGAAYVSLHKVGGFGDGFFTRSEGVLLKSANLLTERDPDKLTWETLPEGDFGLRTPPGGGTIAEEQSYNVLSDGSFYCVYRTIDGYPACAYSRDDGRHWSVPQYQQYADGRTMKHPRAANFAWKCENGKYLYWFHNHGGRFIAEHPQRRSNAYNDRNPAWLCCGEEADGPDGKIIRWSQPEILLYDDDPYIRMSYPDFVEDGGKYFVTETQKTIGHLHEIPCALVNGLFNQFTCRTVAANGLALTATAAQLAAKEVKLPKLPEFNKRDNKSEDMRGQDLRAGFSLDLWLQLDALTAGQNVLDSRDDTGKGLLVTTTENGTLKLVMNDGRQAASWDSDRGMLKAGQLQHVVITVDGGPKIITFVVNGMLCDGGDERQFGWGRYSPTLRTPNGAATAKLAPAVRALRLYSRALRTSEAVGNFRAGCP